MLIIIAWSEADISIEEAVTPENRKFKGSVWLVSYADDKPVNSSNQNALVASAINKGIDFFKLYRKKHINNKFYQDNKHLIDQAGKNGYWLCYEPYFILKALNEAPQNDIIIYVDSGTLVLRDLTPLINLTSTHDIILSKNYFNNPDYIKSGTVVMGMSDNSLGSPIPFINFIIVKNTTKTRAYITKWLEHCKDKHLLTGLPSTKEKYEDLLDNSDHLIFSLIYSKNPEGILLLDEVEDNFILHYKRKQYEFYTSLLLLKVRRTIERWVANINENFSISRN